MSYVMPELVKATLNLLGEAIEASVGIVAGRVTAPLCGVESTGQFGADDMGDDPYAYLGRPGHLGRELCAA